MFLSITAFFEAIKSFFNLKETKTNKQLETAGIKEYRKLVKACNYATELIDYLERHNAVNFETYKQQQRYNYLVRKFREKVI
ncbi:MAG: hypothetical protein MJ211_10105 [Bacteroidales bacterium]|nr:hypothetical protein [Bacteroidales bacterium]